MVAVRTQILWSVYKLGSWDKSRSNSLASVAKAKRFTLPVVSMNERPHIAYITVVKSAMFGATFNLVTRIGLP